MTEPRWTYVTPADGPSTKLHLPGCRMMTETEKLGRVHPVDDYWTDKPPSELGDLLCQHCQKRATEAFGGPLSEVIHRHGGLARAESHEEVATAAGRIVSAYVEGPRLMFLMLSDGAAELQVIVTPQRFGQENWEWARGLEVGQEVAVRGVVSRTRRGVLSVLAQMRPSL